MSFSLLGYIETLSLGTKIPLVFLFNREPVSGSGLWQAEKPSYISLALFGFHGYFLFMASGTGSPYAVRPEYNFFKVYLSFKSGPMT